MSRYCGKHDVTPIIDAAHEWRDKCLLANGSMFTNSNIWTKENVEQLVRHFVENLDWGEGDFFHKLSDQLQPTTDEAKLLAAEMLWVMFLCPSNNKPETKRKNINTILGWTGIDVDLKQDVFSDEVLKGVGSGGPGYNQLRWKELVYFLK